MWCWFASDSRLDPLVSGPQGNSHTHALGQEHLFQAFAEALRGGLHHDGCRLASSLISHISQQVANIMVEHGCRDPRRTHLGQHLLNRSFQRLNQVFSDEDPAPKHEHALKNSTVLWMSRNMRLSPAGAATALLKEKETQSANIQTCCERAQTSPHGEFLEWTTPTSLVPGNRHCFGCLDGYLEGWSPAWRTRRTAFHRRNDARAMHDAALLQLDRLSAMLLAHCLFTCTMPNSQFTSRSWRRRQKLFLSPKKDAIGHVNMWPSGSLKWWKICSCECHCSVQGRAPNLEHKQVTIERPNNDPRLKLCRAL